MSRIEWRTFGRGLAILGTAFLVTMMAAGGACGADIYPDSNEAGAIGTESDVRRAAMVAAADYRQEADLHPGSLQGLQALRELGFAYLQAGRKTEAIEVCREIVAAKSFRTRAATCATDVGQAAYDCGDYATAKVIFDLVCARWPKGTASLPAREGQAKIVIFQEDELHARQVVDKLWLDCQDTSKAPHVMLRVAECLERHKGSASARELYARIAAKWPSTPPGVKAAAAVLLAEIRDCGASAAAQRIETAIDEGTASSGLAAVAIADEYSRQGQTAKAVAIYERVAAMNAVDESVLAALGGGVRGHIILGNMVKAEGLLQQMHLRFGSSPAMREELARIADTYRQTGRPLKAAAVYGYISGRWPATAAGIRGRMWLAASGATNDDDFGRRLSESAANAGPPDIVEEGMVSLLAALQAEASERVRNGDVAAARAIALRAAKGWRVVQTRFPTEHQAEVLYSLADCCLMAERIPEAATCFERCAREYPLSRIAASAQFMVGECYRMLRDRGQIDQTVGDNKMKASYWRVLRDYPGGCQAKAAELRLTSESISQEGGVR